MSNVTSEGGSKIRRITPEEADRYVACKDDQLNTPAYYFTFTPDSENPGWDKVTYYTNRLKHIHISKPITGAQYIYILTNTTMPGLVKIGFTKNKPSDRVKQINSATGVAQDFTVEYQYPCFNAHDLENEIHTYLDSSGFRVNKKKEFFNISVSEAISVVEKLGEPYKMSEDE